MRPRLWMAGLAGVWVVGMALSGQVLRTTELATIRRHAATRAIAPAPRLPRPAAVAAPAPMLRPAPAAPATASSQLEPSVPLDDLRLLGTSVQDAGLSLAVFELRATSEVATYAVGDAVYGWQLAAIGRDHVILLDAHHGQHRMGLEGAPEQGADTAALSPDGDGWRSIAAQIFHAPEPMTDEAKGLLTSAITPISDTERRVDRRKVWDAIKGNPFQVLREATMVPAFDNFRLAGVKLLAVPDDGLLRQGGLRPGDVIQAVNGQPMTDPSRVLQLPGLLQSTGSVDVQVLRDGHPVTLTYRLQ